MSFKDKITWQNTIALVGLLIGIIGLYPLFHKEKPEITYEIVHTINVLDINQPTDDLAIFYKGEDIQKNNLELQLMNIVVKNTGDVNIRQNDYDQKEIWGFALPNGKIMEARIAETDESYLGDNISPRITKDSFIEFNKVIFDSGREFVLEVLVLKNKNDKIEVIPLGKIAGLDTIPVITPEIKKEKEKYKGILTGIIIGVLMSGFYVISLRYLVNTIYQPENHPKFKKFALKAAPLIERAFGVRRKNRSKLRDGSIAKDSKDC